MIGNALERGEIRESADVCVVGSGAGGAVAAAELAEAGLSVVVLEQGHHWTSRDFTQREDEMLPRLFEEGGMRQTVDGGVIVLQGRNVGGSTVHNLCYAFRTPPAILRMWREEHGLPELTDEAMAPSFERVERHLQVKPIQEREVNALNRLVRQGTEALGYSGFVTRHNRENCVLSGYCILGCSYDAKQSMLVTYVPSADDAGARRVEDPTEQPQLLLQPALDELQLDPRAGPGYDPHDLGDRHEIRMRGGQSMGPGLQARDREPSFLARPPFAGGRTSPPLGDNPGPVGLGLDHRSDDRQTPGVDHPP